MKSTITLAALIVAGLSTSVFAADAPAAAAAPAAAVSESAAMSSAANAEQARKLLIAQGYTNVSELTRDDKGRWNGTAMKDGKSAIVAIALPEKAAGDKAPAPAAKN